MRREIPRRIEHHAHTRDTGSTTNIVPSQTGYATWPRSPRATREYNKWAIEQSVIYRKLYQLDGVLGTAGTPVGIREGRTGDVEEPG